MNYYEILGLSSNATDDEIKTAYRTLCKKYHPDVNDASNAATFFRLIQEAYETLSKHTSRIAYDNSQKYQSTTSNVSYDYEEYSTPETDYTYEPKPVSKKHKILICLLKIILAPLLPVLAFINHCLIIISSVAILICRFIFGIALLSIVLDFFMSDLNSLNVVFALVIAFIFFCLPYIILTLPAGLMFLSETIKDFVFDN